MKAVEHCRATPRTAGPSSVLRSPEKASIESGTNRCAISMERELMRGRTHARVQEAAAYEPVRRAGEGVESSNVEGIVPQAVGALNCVLLGDHNENRVI